VHAFSLVPCLQMQEARCLLSSQQTGWLFWQDWGRNNSHLAPTLTLDLNLRRSELDRNQPGRASILSVSPRDPRPDWDLEEAIHAAFLQVLLAVGAFSVLFLLQPQLAPATNPRRWPHSGPIPASLPIIRAASALPWTTPVAPTQG
jgi:hypothetical protein